MRTHLASNDALCLKHCGVLRETCDFGVTFKVLIQNLNFRKIVSTTTTVHTSKRITLSLTPITIKIRENIAIRENRMTKH